MAVNLDEPDVNNVVIFFAFVNPTLSPTAYTTGILEKGSDLEPSGSMLVSDIIADLSTLGATGWCTVHLQVKVNINSVLILPLRCSFARANVV